jgi:hypothetical protein
MMEPSMGTEGLGQPAAGGEAYRIEGLTHDDGPLSEE